MGKIDLDLTLEGVSQIMATEAQLVRSGKLIDLA